MTSSISEKRRLLQSERAANLFIDVLYDYRSDGKYLLHSFVVMPDHFHALITVGAGMTVERAVQLIKGGFAFRAGKEFGFKPPLWQRGFSEVRIYDGEHLDRVLEYIAKNAVRERLAIAPHEYAYCWSYPGFTLDEVPHGLKPVDARALVGTSKDVP